MTQTAKLHILINHFDTHFAHNKKRPAGIKVQYWFVLQVAGWKRAEWRKGQARIDARIAERWPEAK